MTSPNKNLNKKNQFCSLKYIPSYSRITPFQWSILTQADCVIYWRAGKLSMTDVLVFYLLNLKSTYFIFEYPTGIINYLWKGQWSNCCFLYSLINMLYCCKLICRKRKYACLVVNKVFSLSFIPRMVHLYSQRHSSSKLPLLTFWLFSLVLDKAKLTFPSQEPAFLMLGGCTGEFSAHADWWNFPSIFCK